MTRSTDQRLDDILEAIAHARAADERMQLAESLSDEIGVQIAFESILHNLFIIGEAVKAIPTEVLDVDPNTPWREITALRDVIGHHYHRIIPEVIHGTVMSDLGPLEGAVKRLRHEG